MFVLYIHLIFYKFFFIFYLFSTVVFFLYIICNRLSLTIINVYKFFLIPGLTVSNAIFCGRVCLRVDCT
ncbi:hypothetical protein VNO78_18734 [Psophocarpus tetragonolobus]|uniref:Uncharacterized protein n=1 Tax=Psophocarpus tetragonolobus TaxID=3891 RepID=A0AAN9S8S3_PSOTE